MIELTRISHHAAHETSDKSMIDHDSEECFFHRVVDLLNLGSHIINISLMEGEECDMLQVTMTEVEENK